MIQNQPNPNTISELQAEIDYWKRQYEEKTFDFSGANVTVNDLPYGVYAWNANGQLITGPILNTDSPALGETVYFTAYPSITWQVQHLDGNYVYLALYPMTENSIFGSSESYSGSTIASKCTNYLNNTIPNVADCLEEVTVNGVTTKVFIPSYNQLTSEWYWPKAGSSNRICQLNGSNSAYWTSTGTGSGYNYVWRVSASGDIGGVESSYAAGFRPAVKVQYKG